MAYNGNSGVPQPLAPSQDGYYTTNSGLPVKDPQAILKVGNQPQTLQLLRDINLLETISHVTHERIPERLVHAKGAGVWGEFECTSDDIKNYTDAAFLSQNGKKTKLFSRFSTVAGGRGSADTVRDTRGFAFKMFTEQGNLDWLFFSEPVFPIRDGGKFPSFVHAQKGEPGNGIFNPQTFWEFFNANSEAFHALMMIFSDRGTPQGYQYSDIFSLNTYKFTKLNPPQDTFVKIHLKPTLGVKNWNRTESAEVAGKDPDYHSRSLLQAIQDAQDKKPGKEFPAWYVYMQIINNAPPELVFDPTKTISQTEFPLIPFGKITLTGIYGKDPSVTVDDPTKKNFFDDTESVSFNPTAIVPGWDLTPDPILQTRLFANGSAARYRLGVNFYQNSVNSPLFQYNPTKRDGQCNVDNLGNLPNYIPGDQSRVIIVDKPTGQFPPAETYNGPLTSYDSVVTPDDYVQPRELWENVLSIPDGPNDPPVDPANPKLPPPPAFPPSFSGQQKRLVMNVAASLSMVASAEIRNTTYGVFYQINKDLASSIQAYTEYNIANPTDPFGNPVPPAEAMIMVHHLT